MYLDFKFYFTFVGSEEDHMIWAVVVVVGADNDGGLVVVGDRDVGLVACQARAASPPPPPPSPLAPIQPVHSNHN